MASEDIKVNTSFARYSTPTHRLRVKGVDISEYDVFVTYKQGHVTKTFSGEEVVMETETSEQEGEQVTDTIIFVHMGQADSSLFRDGDIEVQVNWLVGEQRFATLIATTNATRNLLTEVI